MKIHALLISQLRQVGHVHNEHARTKNWPLGYRTDKVNQKWSTAANDNSKGPVTQICHCCSDRTYIHVLAVKAVDLCKLANLVIHYTVVRMLYGARPIFRATLHSLIIDNSAPIDGHTVCLKKYTSLFLTTPKKPTDFNNFWYITSWGNFTGKYKRGHHLAYHLSPQLYLRKCNNVILQQWPTVFSPKRLSYFFNHFRSIHHFVTMNFGHLLAQVAVNIFSYRAALCVSAVFAVARYVSVCQSVSQVRVL